MVCAACPNRRAQPSQHCAGCGQHLHATRHPNVWGGVRCLTKCPEHPSGFHRPPEEPTDPFDAFAVRDLMSKGLDRETARTVVDNTYRRDN